MSGQLTLYTYWRSSAAYRVRIGLALKGLEYASEPVHLVQDGGQQHAAAFAALNPQELVPVLRHGDQVLRQSLAILEYIDEAWPEPALLPADAGGRARVRALAQAIACDVHPLNNLRVLQYLERELDVAAPAREAWVRHWIGSGLDAVEKLLAGDPGTGAFCHGDAPGLADCVLVPQLYNARRFGLDVAGWPVIARIDAACAALPAFAAAVPEAQPDAPRS